MAFFNKISFVFKPLAHTSWQRTLSHMHARTHARTHAHTHTHTHTHKLNGLTKHTCMLFFSATKCRLVTCSNVFTATVHLAELAKLCDCLPSVNTYSLMSADAPLALSTRLTPRQDPACHILLQPHNYDHVRDRDGHVLSLGQWPDKGVSTQQEGRLNDRRDRDARVRRPLLRLLLHLNVGSDQSQTHGLPAAREVHYAEHGVGDLRIRQVEGQPRQERHLQGAARAGVTRAATPLSPMCACVPSRHAVHAG